MRHFCVHSQYRGLRACYLTHGWVEAPPGSQAYGAGDRPKPKGPVTEPSEAESCFQVYSWDHSWQVSCLVWACLLKTALLIHGLHQASPLPGALSSHKGTFVYGQMPNCLGGVIQARDVLFGHLADVSLWKL